jgi:hypothetical protein
LSLEQIDKLFTGDKILLHWDHSMGVPGEAPEKSDVAVVETAEKTEHSDDASAPNTG